MWKVSLGWNKTYLRQRLVRCYKLYVILGIVTLIIKFQIKGKESKNSYQGIEEITKGQAHTNTWKLYRDISTGMAVFFNRKRVNVCEHQTKTALLESLRKVPPGGCERDGWREII